MSYYVMFPHVVLEHPTRAFVKTPLARVHSRTRERDKRNVAFSTEPHEKHLDRHYLRIFTEVPRSLKNAVAGEKIERKKAGKRLKEFRALGFEPIPDTSLISLNIGGAKGVVRRRLEIEEERRVRRRYLQDVYYAICGEDIPGSVC